MIYIKFGSHFCFRFVALILQMKAYNCDQTEFPLSITRPICVHELITPKFKAWKQ